RSESGGQMLARLQAMTLKVAMLIAAGWPTTTDNESLLVTSTDGDAAIQIIERWKHDALLFAERIGESAFERKLQMCLRLVQSKGRVRRKFIADRCHMEKRLLDAIQETLVDRGKIRVITTPPHQKGGQTMIEWEICQP